nr:MAG TPA: hypothetical protein [Caudoviricetes sp.]
MRVDRSCKPQARDIECRRYARHCGSYRTVQSSPRIQTVTPHTLH